MHFCYVIAKQEFLPTYRTISPRRRDLVDPTVLVLYNFALTGRW